MSATQQRIQQIQQLAEDRFAQHVLRQTYDYPAYKSWHCGRPAPTGGAYWFYIHLFSNWLFMEGDLGVFLVTRQPNMLEWARSAIADPYYFLEKVPTDFAIREFSPEAAVALVQDVKQHPANYGLDSSWNHPQHDGWVEPWYRRLEELARAGEEREFLDLFFQRACDAPNLQTFTHQVLWQREAVKCWLRLLDKEPTDAQVCSAGHLDESRNSNCGSSVTGGGGGGCGGPGHG